MVAETVSGMVQGVEGTLVEVQADISSGLPVFMMIGLLSSEVKEAKERVRTAMKNSGYILPPRRVAVNLAPADIKKYGTGFDLAITVALFVSLGIVFQERVRDMVFVGELALDGSLSALPGVLPIVKEARDRGYSCCVVPAENVREASVIENIRIVGITHITELAAWLSGGQPPEYTDREPGEEDDDTPDPALFSSFRLVGDLSRVRGQKNARRALEIAAAGFHNLFLDGPPGVGKSMVASCLPGIMPPMTLEEMIETTMVYSVKGLLSKRFSLIRDRPFRAPSHAVTFAGMFGGGRIPKPGEISLAHHGVLFLDELPEFGRDMIEKFRIPLETNEIQLTRFERTLTFPADFLLIAAANPCPCGYYPDLTRCRCFPNEIIRYRNKLSGPVLDRIDLFVRCDEVSYEDLSSKDLGESSASVQKRVMQAWERQQERFAGAPIHFNGRMTQEMIERYCRLEPEGSRLMGQAFQVFSLSGRSYFRILRIARTIADLDGSDSIKLCHLEEALHFRMVMGEKAEKEFVTPSSVKRLGGQA